MKTLVKRTPNAFFSGIPSIFDEFFHQEFNRRGLPTNQLPLVNIQETDKAYLMELALPGYSKDEIKINVENDTLHIESEHKEEKETSERGYTRKEFSKSSFKRSFSLPENIDIDHIEARNHDGVLLISLLKKDINETKEAKAIQIK